MVPLRDARARVSAALAALEASAELSSAERFAALGAALDATLAEQTHNRTCPTVRPPKR